MLILAITILANLAVFLNSYKVYKQAKQIKPF
jgi:hypothetical protein